MNVRQRSDKKVCIYMYAQHWVGKDESSKEN